MTEVASTASPPAIQRAGRSADGFITAFDNEEHINQTFRSVEQAWHAAGQAGKPYLVAQIDIALEVPQGGKGARTC